MRTAVRISPAASTVVYGPRDEIADRNATHAGRRSQRHRRIERHQHHHPVRGRISVAQAAADRAAIADRLIRDRAGDACQPPVSEIWRTAAGDRSVGDAGTKRDGVGRFVDTREVRQVVDLHQQLRLHHAQVQHRPERLAAGEHARLGTALRQRGDRVGHAGRTQQVERRGLHVARASRAARMRRGVIGNAVISTPSGASASFTALAIAAGGPIAPPSPMPF